MQVNDKILLIKNNPPDIFHRDILPLTGIPVLYIIDVITGLQEVKKTDACS
jgi:hypothetical protein